MRQGCPLSPLLFIMVLEVLLKAVQEDVELVGIKHKGFQYKYRAFADNVLFIMKEPMESVPKLFDKISDYGELAGFFINRNKSKLICKNMTNQQQKDLRTKVL